MPWVYDPHSGGKKIPKDVQERTEKRIRAFAERKYAGKFTRLGIRFRGALCYIDAYTEPVKPTLVLERIKEIRDFRAYLQEYGSRLPAKLAAEVDEVERRLKATA